MKVLLSIKPEFADKILSGTKKFEFRKVIFKAKEVRSIVIYSSSPVRKVIGEFDISEIFEMDPRELWERTSEFSGIEKDYFDEYFDGKETGFAIEVGSFKKYKKPLNLKDLGVSSPPQSFCYLKEKLSLTI
ncbi:ASCH domain-containing protein [Thiomicrorhabdus sp.]|uniref:ASCH domain-containing protein n=1 Tax=Thiomicrorhabdus sp. TaxID=2039724 RepID=UPI0029C67A9F|nr:ASCH domain-containing protein [Thiomicrorhabdus sp.]